ncbi:hypothetical protein SUGI_0281610 [Cryptomeria japonica]|nr:hypothetical protein SUGI_0281610 [Cryptomeria japonica]
MIKSVLSAVLIFSMSCFKMPYAAGKSLDSLLKKFVWDGAKEQKKIPLINWDTMCLLKEGGVGLRKMELQNISLGEKLTWKIYKEQQKLWCRLFRKKYLDSDESNRIITMANTVRGSATWNFIWDSIHIITEHVSWRILNRRMTKFWRDSWDGEPTLSDLFEYQDQVHLVEFTMGRNVCNYFEEVADCGGKIVWKKVAIDNTVLCDKLVEILRYRTILASSEDDMIFWCASKFGEYSVKLGYEI